MVREDRTLERKADSKQPLKAEQKHARLERGAGAAHTHGAGHHRAGRALTRSPRPQLQPEALRGCRGTCRHLALLLACPIRAVTAGLCDSRPPRPVSSGVATSAPGQALTPGQHMASSSLSTADPPLLWVNARRCEWGQVLSANVLSPYPATVPLPPSRDTSLGQLQSQSWKARAGRSLVSESLSSASAQMRTPTGLRRKELPG